GSSAAATVSKLPLSGGGGTGTPVVEGQPDTKVEANIRTVSPGYFSALGLPLASGRVFDAGDTADRERVIVGNRALAWRLFGNASPVGARITFTFVPQPLTVVGVVGDENVTAPDRPVTGVVYVPFAQDAGGYLSVVVRTTVRPETLARAATERL